MLGSAFVYRAQIRLMDVFAKAGTGDKVLTRLQMVFASADQRARIVNSFHKRWEEKLLSELDDGGREIEASSGRIGIVQERREHAQPNLDYARNHKEDLLHFKF